MAHDGADGDGEKRHLDVGLVASEVKKQWKNPSQVQILENAYAVARNPSAAVKEELAKLTGLDYKQVQYWFGNRRYLDRHGPRRYRSRNEDDLRYGNMAFVSSPCCSTGSMPMADSMGGSESSPYRHFGVMQPLLSAGPTVMQTEITTQMPEELQRVLMHIERKLVHGLRTDGPVLGVEFKPLPPGAFGALLAQQKASICPCDGKATERHTDKPNKLYTSLFTAECLVANSDESTLLAQNVDALKTNGSTKDVQEFQFFPTRPSWLDGSERFKQAHSPLSLVTSTDVTKSSSCWGQNFSECACAPSAISCQGQQNAINQSQQDNQMACPSSLNGNKEAPNFFHTTSALDSQPGNHRTSEVDKQLISSDKTITCVTNICRGEKIELPVSISTNESQRHDYTEIQIIDDANKERVLGCPDIDNGNSAQDRGQGGEGISHLQMGSSVKNNCHHFLMNHHTSSDRLHRISHRHRLRRFIVRPHERSDGNIVTKGDTRASYFSNTWSSRTLIAEWNEKDKMAVFTENDTESALSWSTGSDSTCSDGFIDQATENGKFDAQSKSIHQFCVDNKVNDVRKDHNCQEVINFDQNVNGEDYDDDDETDDETNGLEEESGNTCMNPSENRRASPLSSEQTA